MVFLWMGAGFNYCSNGNQDNSMTQPKSLEMIVSELHDFGLSISCECGRIDDVDEYLLEDMKCFLRSALRSYALHLFNEAMPDRKPLISEVGSMKSGEEYGYNFALQDMRDNFEKLING